MTPSPFKKGWKVLKCKKTPIMANGLYEITYLSCVHNNMRSVEYAKDKATVPRADCGPLAVFNTRYDALRFMRKYARLDDSLAPCDYLPSPHNTLWAHDRVFDDPLPEGTRLAAQVTLTREPVTLDSSECFRVMDDFRYAERY